MTDLIHAAAQRRVCFDFELEFTNGGGLQGQDFRLDITGEEIDDQELADYVIRDLRLLMVGPVRILNKRIIAEAHKRTRTAAAALESGTVRFVDLSHAIEDGMVTLSGFPAAVVCDFLSREESRSRYAEGTEFHIGRVDFIANTGTYLDTPFHRFADGVDVAGMPLETMAGLPGLLVRVVGQAGRAVSRVTLLGALGGVETRGRAVLVHTGWDAHWGTQSYFDGHPFLTADAAAYLAEAGVALVGIDSLNIDDTTDGARPVHTTLLGAGIPIVEHLRGLEQLPTSGFRFTAVPPRVRGIGTFPVRAYATLG
jgi:arylformamidase